MLNSNRSLKAISLLALCLSMSACKQGFSTSEVTVGSSSEAASSAATATAAPAANTNPPVKTPTAVPSVPTASTPVSTPAAPTTPAPSVPPPPPPPANIPTPVSIGTPTPATGTKGTYFQFPVVSVGGGAITLTSDQVVLQGPSLAGCQKLVSGSNTANPYVLVLGCTGVGPLSVSIQACSQATTPSCAASTAPSTSVILVNAEPEIAISSNLAASYTGASGAPQSYELYFPTNWQNMANLPLYIHIHGGGWTGGSANLDSVAAEAIAKKGFIVANLNYTLAPAYSAGSSAATPYTAGAEDILAFVKFATNPDTLRTIHADPNKVSIGGGSAGAHLALLQATRSENMVNFNCVVDAAGPTDLNSIISQAVMPLTVDIIRGVYGYTPPFWASPALNTSNLKAQRLLIMHAERDNLVPIAQAYELDSNVKSSRPSTAIIRNYWPDPNPNPSVANHVVPGELVTPTIASYLGSVCR